MNPGRRSEGGPPQAEPQLPARIEMAGELVSREGAEAIRRFADAFFGELGTMDLDALAAAYEKARAGGATIDLSDPHYAARLRDEAKFLLGWRPSSGEPPAWVEFDPGGVPSGPVGEAMVGEVRRGMMRAMARAIPRREPLGKVRSVLAFARSHGVRVDGGRDEEMVRIVHAALQAREYEHDPVALLALAKEAGVELRPTSIRFAFERGISSVFDSLHGVETSDLAVADALFDAARAAGVTLECDKDKVLETHLLRDLALKLKRGRFESAAVVFAFCRKHGIPVNTRSRETSLSESIDAILTHLAHEARNDLDLDGVEHVVVFARENGASPDLPEAMLQRWRAQIPELKAKKSAKSRW